jgi:hypothetical protein
MDTRQKIVDGLNRRGLNFVVESNMRRAIQNQSIQHLVQSAHKAQQRNKHRDAKRHSNSGYQRLLPSGEKERNGNAIDQPELHHFGF